MSTTLLPPSDNEDSHDDDKRHLEPKKERKIEPLSSSHSPDLNIPGADKDLLEELRQKTAALAEEMGGKESPKHKTLDLKKGTETDTEELLRELHEDQPAKDMAYLNAIDDSDKKKVTMKQPDELPEVNPAVAMVREKLSRIYQKEPDAEEEVLESYHAGKNRSKHQQFMYDLTTSGKSLADIQTEWHDYYANLPDDEKHEVWQEFYESQSTIRNNKGPSIEELTSNEDSKHKKPHSKAGPKVERSRIGKPHPPKETKEPRTAGEIKNQLMDKISAGGKLNAVHHAKSLLFGMGLSAIVLLITSFVFFNEAYIAPFISPGQSVSATPIIGNQTESVGTEPKIIIPKINLEVPVVFDLGSVNEADIQNALEDGVVHFASSPNPGEIGNSVIVGHSSNNILNSGKYKFAFVLLKRLEAEDTFFVHRNGIRYTYKVYKKEIVTPSNLSVLQTQERPNTMTLITCDPPGTSINRLIITAEQISPDPADNTESTAPDLTADDAEELPSNAPSLWSRLWPF